MYLSTCHRYILHPLAVDILLLLMWYFCPLAVDIMLHPLAVDILPPLLWFFCPLAVDIMLQLLAVDIIQLPLAVDILLWYFVHFCGPGLDFHCCGLC